jgi:hypothetical protein
MSETFKGRAAREHGMRYGIWVVKAGCGGRHLRSPAQVGYSTVGTDTHVGKIWLGVSTTTSQTDLSGKMARRKSNNDL